MRGLKITAAVTAAGISVFAGAAAAETIPERLMADIGRDFDLQDFQAAGVVGNLARETGNFRYLQELNPIVEGSRGGIGYPQWTATRRVAFEAYAGSLENQLTYEANYGYLKEELTGQYADVMDEVRGSENLWEATVIFMGGYLKPAPNEDNIRVSMNYAGAYLAGDFSGAGCQENHEVTINGRMMVVSTCAQIAGSIGGEGFDVVMESSLRPRARPADITTREVLIADAGQTRPQARPEWLENNTRLAAIEGAGPDPFETGRPDEEMRRAIAEAVVLALYQEPPSAVVNPWIAATISEVAEDIDGSPQEVPHDPGSQWQGVFARKDGEGDELILGGDDDDSPELG